MDTLCQELHRYTVFRLLLDESDDAFFSVIREVTGQFSLFPTEKHEPPEDEQIERIRTAAEKFFKLSEEDTLPEEDALWKPLDLFRPSEADAEMGEAFYYEMFRILGETEGTWDTYRKYIDRYEMYLHDIRAFNGTIRNFIKFTISKLKTNGPESYAEALYGFYNDDRIAEKLIINPITSHGDCYISAVLSPRQSVCYCSSNYSRCRRWRSEGYADRGIWCAAGSHATARSQPAQPQPLFPGRFSRFPMPAPLHQEWKAKFHGLKHPAVHLPHQCLPHRTLAHSL